MKRSEEDQWRLAELTWQQVKQAGVSQRQWAEDVGVSVWSVNKWAQVWERYGVSQANDRPAFNKAMDQVHNREEKRQQEAVANIRKAPVAKKAEVVRELMADDTVREHVLRDRPRSGYPVCRRDRYAR